MKSFLQNLLAELQTVFTDRGVLLVMAIAVVFYSFIYPLPYSREVLRKVPLVVVDQDSSSLSRRLVRMLNASEMVDVSGQAADLRQARIDVDAGRYSAMLVIPEISKRLSCKDAGPQSPLTWMPPTFWSIARP